MRKLFKCRPITATAGHPEQPFLSKSAIERLAQKARRRGPKTRSFSRPDRGCALAFHSIRSAPRPSGPHRHPVPMPRPASGEGRQTRPGVFGRSLPYASNAIVSALGRRGAQNWDVLKQEKVAALFDKSGWPPFCFCFLSLGTIVGTP